MRKSSVRTRSRDSRNRPILSRMAAAMPSGLKAPRAYAALNLKKRKVRK